MNTARNHTADHNENLLNKIKREQEKNRFQTPVQFQNHGITGLHEILMDDQRRRVQIRDRRSAVTPDLLGLKKREVLGTETKNSTNQSLILTS